MLNCLYVLFILLLLDFFSPESGFAIQQHSHAEGIIVHQIGHFFFLFSMLILIFTVTGKGLHKQKGWAMIQISAFLFVLWNLDAFAAHLLDEQLEIVQILPQSVFKMQLVTHSDSLLLAVVYYLLKLDHLLCVPAMLMLYLGISRMVKEHRLANPNKEDR
ncbi:MAG: hypothetical protein KKE62_15750 [Proteobacteria bacterium]|nr:hypothetical protein [Pseudomonadota bacterium]MBU1387302.1 hypothetical protein [Pseudomonadota bacterium]MBU1544284.1 hypothetical protein [Pseudomonadota bacterium]MBU2480610.1 hypothetical protein [Pseudomonadota bacterium]